MSKSTIYYPEQCDYCLKKGKCDYEKQTRLFLTTLEGLDKLTHGVHGGLIFACDYFDLDLLLYNKNNSVKSYEA